MKKLAGKSSSKATADWGDLLQNFTPRARNVMGLAEEYALSLNHPFVGTEHLLVGLIRLGDQGVTQGVLRKAGLQEEDVCHALETIDGRGPATPIRLMLPTPRLKQVFELAGAEAEALGHTYVGTESLLLAMLREGKGVGTHVLRQLGVDLNQLIEEVQAEIRPRRDSS